MIDDDAPPPPDEDYEAWLQDQINRELRDHYDEDE